MIKVEIFWRSGCNFCKKVKQLFKDKNVDYISYDIWEDTQSRSEMNKRFTNKVTVPQVFIDGVSIGGCDDTFELEESGKLDKLLKIT